MTDTNYQGPGTYRHYKGGEYTVLSLACVEASKAEAREFVVIYQPLSPGSLLESMDGVEFWSRPLDDFNEHVDIPQGQCFRDGCGGDTVPRFKKIGSDDKLERAMDALDSATEGGWSSDYAKKVAQIVINA